VGQQLPHGQGRRRRFGAIASATLAGVLFLAGPRLPVAGAGSDEVVHMPVPAGPVRRDASAEATLLGLTNDARTEPGRRPLAPSPLLAAHALRHSITMARLGEVGHAVGAASFQARIDGWALPPGTRVGEVIAVADTANDAMRAFLASHEHRAILLDPTLCEIGWGALDSAWGLVATGDLASCDGHTVRVAPAARTALVSFPRPEALSGHP
jgi:uncharacterized protein YkwD